MELPTFCRSTENEGQQSSLDNVSTYARVSFTSFTWICCSNQPPHPFCCRKIRAQALLQGNMGGCTPYAFHMNTPQKLMLWENYFLLNTWPWVWRKLKRQLFKAPFFFVFGFSPQYFPTSQGSLHYHPKQYIKKTWKLEIPRNYSSDLQCFIFPPKKTGGTFTHWKKIQVAKRNLSKLPFRFRVLHLPPPKKTWGAYTTWKKHVSNDKGVIHPHQWLHLPTQVVVRLRWVLLGELPPA